MARRKGQAKQPDNTSTAQSNEERLENGTFYGITREDGKIMPVMGTGDNGEVAINPAALIQHMRALTLSLGRLTNCFTPLVESAEKGIFLKEPFQALTQALLNIQSQYDESINLCEGIFSVLDIILKNPDSFDIVPGSIDVDGENTAFKEINDESKSENESIKECEDGEQPDGQ